jgi:hypothetical protein
MEETTQKTEEYLGKNMTDTKCNRIYDIVYYSVTEGKCKGLLMRK